MKVSEFMPYKTNAIYAYMDDNTLKATVHHSYNLLYAIARYDFNCNEDNLNKEIRILETDIEDPDAINIRLAYHVANLKNSGWTIENERMIPKPRLRLAVRRDFRLESRANYLAYVEVAFRRKVCVLGVFDKVEEAELFEKSSNLADLKYATNELTTVYRNNYTHHLPKSRRRGLLSR